MLILLDIHRVVQRFIRRYMTGKPKGVRESASPDPFKPLPPSHLSAAASLVDRGTVSSISFVARGLKTPEDGAHPDILKFSKAMQKELAKRGMPFFPFEYYRDPARSEALFKQGVSKARGGQSPHNYGMAVDLIHYPKAWNLTRLQWAVIGHIGKEVSRRVKVPVTWGGEFKSIYDPAHWELADWKSRVRDLKKQENPPMV